MANNLRAYLGGSDVQGFLDGTKVIFSKMQNPPGTGAYKMYTDAMAVWKGKPGETRPLLIGMPQDRNGDPTIKGKQIYFQTFPAGGSGYALNRAALDLFVEDCLPNFLPNATNSRF